MFALCWGCLVQITIAKNTVIPVAVMQCIVKRANQHVLCATLYFLVLLSIKRKLVQKKCFSKSISMRRQEKQTANCKICKESFTLNMPAQIYCSKKCVHISNTKPIEKICVICNIEFKNKLTGVKTCSKECKGKLMTQSKLTNNKPRKKKPDLVINCTVCLKLYTVPRKQRNRKTCSAKCLSARKAETAKATKTKPPHACTCIICSTEFLYKRTGKTVYRKTCSDDCLQELRTLNSGYGKKFNVVDTTGNNVKLDSSWEKEIYDYLVKHGITWERPESLMWEDAEQKQHKYYSDFFLPEYEVYLDPKNPKVIIQQYEKLKYFRNKISLFYGEVDYLKSIIDNLRKNTWQAK